MIIETIVKLKQIYIILILIKSIKLILTHLDIVPDSNSIMLDINENIFPKDELTEKSSVTSTLYSMEADSLAQNETNDPYSSDSDHQSLLLSLGDSDIENEVEEEIKNESRDSDKELVRVENIMEDNCDILYKSSGTNSVEQCIEIEDNKISNHQNSGTIIYDHENNVQLHCSSHNVDEIISSNEENDSNNNVGDCTAGNFKEQECSEKSNKAENVSSLEKSEHSLEKLDVNKKEEYLSRICKLSLMMFAELQSWKLVHYSRVSHWILERIKSETEFQVKNRKNFRWNFSEQKGLNQKLHLILDCKDL